DTSFKRNKARARASLDSALRIFRTLHRDGQIDGDFLEFATRKCRAYYAAVLGVTLITPTQQLVFKKDSSAYSEHAIRTMENRWQQLMDLCGVYDAESAGPGAYLEYADLYNMWYLGYIKGNLNGTFRKFETEDAYDRFQYDNIRRYYRGPLAEY